MSKTSFFSLCCSQNDPIKREMIRASAKCKPWLLGDNLWSQIAKRMRFTKTLKSRARWEMMSLMLRFCCFLLPNEMFRNLNGPFQVWKGILLQRDDFEGTEKRKKDRKKKYYKNSLWCKERRKTGYQNQIPLHSEAILSSFLNLLRYSIKSKNRETES